MADAGERFFRFLVEESGDMLYRLRVHPDFRVEFVSDAARRITGHAPNEFYADPMLASRAVHPDDAHLLVLSSEGAPHLPSDTLLRWVRPDGAVVWAEHRRVPVYDGAGQLVAIEGFARDVTERVETQRQLKESEEQLRLLAARVQAAREDERTTLARELHDELGQTLTAVKLELARATEELVRQNMTPLAVDRIQALVGLIEIGLETVKRISTELRPPALDHLGLAAAVRWEAMTFRARTGLRCHVRAPEELKSLDKEQQTVLFRILQEALTNVVRHAHASAVHIVLAERARSFELRIRDNGRGITDEDIRSPQSIGLVGMRERATLVGGTFEIEGRRGKGTTVSVRLATTPPSPMTRRTSASRGGKRHA